MTNIDIKHACTFTGHRPEKLNAPEKQVKEWLEEKIRQGYRPELVIAVPVGFVNVVAAKERIMQVCAETGVPCICNRGRKGGSNVAAAICNAIMYRL